MEETLVRAVQTEASQMLRALGPRRRTASSPWLRLTFCRVLSPWLMLLGLPNLPTFQRPQALPPWFFLSTSQFCAVGTGGGCPTAPLPQAAAELPLPRRGGCRQKTAKKTKGVGRAWGTPQRQPPLAPVHSWSLHGPGVPASTLSVLQGTEPRGVNLNLQGKGEFLYSLAFTCQVKTSIPL